MKTNHLTRLVVSLLLLVVACKPSAVAADTPVKYEPGGVLISVPSNWRSQGESDRLVLKIPDSSLTMIFFAPNQRGMEAGMAEVDKAIKNRTDTGVDMRGKQIADKMHVQNYYGTGEVDGQQMRWMMTLVDKATFEEPRLAVLTIAKPKDLESNLQTVMRILTSLRRIQ